MPYYELRCVKCQNEFTLKASVSERSQGALQCPSCGSNELAAIFRRVNIMHYQGKDCDVCPGQNTAPSGACCGGACSHHHH
jgi:putative FmdB family regulatory protein